MFRELLTYMLGDAALVAPALDLVLISRHLERVGDHATNIAEDVIFLGRRQRRSPSCESALIAQLGRNGSAGRTDTPRLQGLVGVNEGCQRNGMRARSAYGDRRDGGSSGPLDFQGLHDERELVNPLVGELIELQVLEQENSVDDERDLVDRQVDTARRG